MTGKLKYTGVQAHSNKMGCQAHRNTEGEKHTEIRKENIQKNLQRDQLKEIKNFGTKKGITHKEIEDRYTEISQEKNKHRDKVGQGHENNTSTSKKDNRTSTLK